MNLLVIFIYPLNRKYLVDLVESINEQTYKKFTVFFFNDGYPGLQSDLENLELPYQIKEVDGTPFDNRVTGLRYVRDSNAKMAVLQDADDAMPANRMDQCIKHLQSNAFLVNDLDLIDESGSVIQKKYWSARLEHNASFDYRFIETHNLLGFTNTAFRTELLNFLPAVKNDAIIAADWFLFYLMLRKSSKKVRFINTTRTCYRQHRNSIAGLNKLSRARLEKAKEVKLEHYQGLIHLGYDFGEALKETHRLNIQKDISNYNTNTHHFWWEETKYFNEKS